MGGCIAGRQSRTPLRSDTCTLSTHHPQPVVGGVSSVCTCPHPRAPLRAPPQDSEVRLLALQASSAPGEGRASSLEEKGADARRQYARVLRAHMGVELRREEEQLLSQIMKLADVAPSVDEVVEASESSGEEVDELVEDPPVRPQQVCQGGSTMVVGSMTLVV